MSGAVSMPELVDAEGEVDIRDTAKVDKDQPVPGHNDAFLLVPPLAAAENWAEYDSNTTSSTIAAGSSSADDAPTSLTTTGFSTRIEERIEILRRHRSQHHQRVSSTGNGRAGSGGETEVQRGRNARLADQLRERFHIRTRAHSPVGTDAPAGGS
ncbi:hypothetical protein NEMBOFW57_006204 [Staphylotrichum longicolle]|uniref:Uncharacterized protein n=1 Tax=Staphylotrichum longicolle TaxID=669026 RepID=A0AAD4EYH1_9PEZI|nr:hypothetical protein NEMBOFW57_006204 [Staphylotrichum longicolle]